MITTIVTVITGIVVYGFLIKGHYDHKEYMKKIYGEQE